MKYRPLRVVVVSVATNTDAVLVGHAVSVARPGYNGRDVELEG